MASRAGYFDLDEWIIDLSERATDILAEQNARMGFFIRTFLIGLAKAKAGLANLAHNLKRLAYLKAKAA